jgi:hypothetical protein
MGYRSDVLLAVAFETEEQLNDVWAIYCMNPKVQEHDIAKHWEKKKTDGDYPVLWYYANDVKWYDGYEDVMAFEALFDLVEAFKNARGGFFNYAWLKIRLGEEDDDNERNDRHSKEELGEYLYECANLRRAIEHSF